MINNSEKEKARHSSKLVPYSYYKCESLCSMNSGYVPSHWHEEFEINYIINGSSEFKCGEKTFIAGKGDIVFISPNMLHSIYPYMDSDQQYETLVFSGELLGISSNDQLSMLYLLPIINSSYIINPHINSAHPYYEEIKTSIENVFSCVKSGDILMDFLLKSELIKILWLLYENGDIYDIRNKSSNMQSDECIKSAIAYIEKNFQNEINVQQLSEIAHLSKSHFMNRFKKATGIGAVSYIIHLRIKNACEILQNSEKSIVETAFDCGFKNISNFNRQFKKIVGCSPHEYRNIIKKT